MKRKFLEAGPECEHYVGDDKTSYTCEVMDLRSRQLLQDRTDVFNILRGFPFLSDILHQPNKEAFGYYTDRSFDFWDDARPDLPWQLTDSIRSGPNLRIPWDTRYIDEQVLSRHTDYADTIIVWGMLQSLRRGDGMVPRSGSDPFANSYLASCSQCHLLLESTTPIRDLGRGNECHCTQD